MELSNINQKISSIKDLFNNIRDTLSHEQIDQIRTNIYKKDAIYNFLTKKDKLTHKESKVLDNINTYFNKLHDDLLEQNKYQYNPYGLDLLFNKDDYYKPPLKLRVLLMVIMYYMRVMVIKMGYYMYLNILIKLNHTYVI